MPVKISIKDKGSRFIYPSTEWKAMRLKAAEIEVDPDFYVQSAKITR